MGRTIGVAGPYNGSKEADPEPTPMRILQVISSTRTSGAERHIVLLSDSLRLRGHEVRAVCPIGGWLPAMLRQAGIPTTEVSMHGMMAPKTIGVLRGLSREMAVDVIHTHLTRATYMGFFAGAAEHVPVISTVHVATRDFAYRFLPTRNHWYVAVSEYLRQRLLDRGVPADHVETVYNGTDFGAEDKPARLDGLSVGAELGLPPEAVLVGELGRVDAFKGQHILVKAAPQIVRRCPQAYFIFVGYAEPAIQQHLWEMASSAGVADRLRFTGVRNDVPRLMEAMDVVTLPSLTEACSMAIIESMAIGKPVVATRAGGNVELIVEGETGNLVERNPEALAHAIAGLLDDPVERRRMGEAGKRRAGERFTSSAMAASMEQFYQRVTARSAAQRA